MPKTLTIVALAAAVAAFFTVKAVGQPVADAIDNKLAGQKALPEGEKK